MGNIIIMGRVSENNFRAVSVKTNQFHNDALVERKYRQYEQIEKAETYGWIHKIKHDRNEIKRQEIKI
ncbi:MAG: hypothetical protein EBU34_14610 [Alphaproteobacteria bacterium]|nr:hypothetical protein [Alphaproteobacteria bacterium]